MATGDLLDRASTGDKRALARVLTIVENDEPGAADIVRRTFPQAGRALVLGVTGPPGGGKSTLVSRLVGAYRAAGKRVAVVAVDPSSPFTGGAILGDRVRMQRRALDPGVFIRSMGSRGHLGGLARATHDAVRVLDALGKDLVLVETVGVGQGEVDIVGAADTVVVVTAPGLGDDVQAIKAGIMEIGDVFVVNKSDREGADRAAAELESTLQMAGEISHPAPDSWRPPVLKVSAEKGAGVPELLAALDAHRAWQQRTGALATRRRAAREAEVLEILKARLVRDVLDEERLGPTFRQALAKVERGSLDPYAAAQELLDGLAR